MPKFAILSVCTANICRSPLIQMRLRDRLDLDAFDISSAGIMGWDRKPMDPGAAAELERLGSSPADFRSRPITPSIAKGADLILTATKEHRSAVLEMSPGSLRRAFTLLEFAALVEQCEADDLSALVREAAQKRSLGPADADVMDPYRQGGDIHARVAEQIEAAVGRIAAVLNRITAT